MEFLTAAGLKVVTQQKVLVKDLYMQIRHEWPLYKEKKSPKSCIPLNIFKSPFYRLIHDWESKKKQRFIFGTLCLWNSDYVKFWREVDAIGYKYDWYDANMKVPVSYSYKKILKKVGRFIHTYNSIKTSGYLSAEYENRHIIVLGEPFENMKYDFDHEVSGYEIWSGHHRAASLAYLGVNEVEVIIAGEA